MCLSMSCPISLYFYACFFIALSVITVSWLMRSFSMSSYSFAVYLFTFETRQLDLEESMHSYFV